MSTKPSVAISYWAYPLGDDQRMQDLAGINDFEAELSQDFNVFVSGKPTDSLGGGLYELAVVILHNESVKDALLFGSGLATDMAKDALKELLVNKIGKPLRNAFAKLKQKNEEKVPEIDTLEIRFKDMQVLIYNVCPDGILRNLDIVMDLLGVRIQEFLNDGQLPSYVYIPVFFDKAASDDDWQHMPVYRRLEKVDETIKVQGDEDYLNYWGMFYPYHTQGLFKVYQVRTKKLIDARIESPDYGSFN